VQLHDVGRQPRVEPRQRFRIASLQMLTLHDNVAVSLAWTVAVRAGNAGSVRGEDLQDVRRQAAAAATDASQGDFPYPAGFKWQLAPNGSIVWQQQRAGVLPRRSCRRS
jgi:hypothetical protein